jgi:hypothetical protein
MDIQVISFVLAVVVGVLCFGLVKHTADEFDRWYEEPSLTAKLRVPTLTGIIASFAIVAVFLFAR